MNMNMLVLKKPAESIPTLSSGITTKKISTVSQII